MMWMYIKMASRILVRQKVFSSINVLGLSVSMAVCILILQYVRFEFSYDDFHRDADNIYRVATKVTLQNQVINHEANTYVGISNALRNNFPEVKASTTVRQYDSDRNFIRFERDDKKLVTIQSFKALEVDSTFLNVFSFELIDGNSLTALRDPYSVVVSETLCKQYFSSDAVGKVIELYDGDQTKRYRITGVLRDVPPNSHVKFDLLTRSASTTTTFWNGEIGFWDWSGQTYVLLHDNSEPAQLEKKLDNLAVSNNGLKRNNDDYGQVSTFHLQPLADIHLFSHLQEELEANGNGLLVYALIILALIIIIIAWINYINLSTAISETKIKAIGIRRVTGASRSTLVVQTLMESACFNTLSVTIAVLIVQLLHSSFADFLGIPLDYGSLIDKRLLASIGAFTLTGTFVAGIYPAIVISSFHPVRALKGNVKVGGFSFRKILVVFQFGAAAALMIATVVLYQQLSFMRSKELGIAIDKIVIIKALNFDKEKWSDTEGGYKIDSLYLSSAKLFKEQVRSHASFLSATSLSHLPGQLPNWGTEFKAESIDNAKAYRLVAVGIDYDFLTTFQVRLLAGRNFSPNFPSDRGNEGKRAVLINEAASKLLGFKSPEDAVKKHLSTYWRADYEIVGVVSSFHQLSLKENLQPIYFILQPRALEYFAIHYQGKNAKAAIGQLESIWKQNFPDYPFNYFFLDQYFDQQYRYDEKFRDIMVGLSGLAVFVACLGLFGLTSYAIVQRTKEIGIRKILGASVSNIIGLFNHDFIKLIIVGTSISIPVVYLGISRWLENYAFRITLGWWYFLIPVILILFIAVVTISVQTFGLASRNPVDSLRQE
jgi:putative ABC transport system permease protein